MNDLCLFTLPPKVGGKPGMYYLAWAENGVPLAPGTTFNNLNPTVGGEDYCNYFFWLWSPPEVTCMELKNE